MDTSIAELERRLESALPSGGLAVAFSGGADSTLVLAGAARRGRAVAVTADSPSLARIDLAGARAVAARLGCEHRVIATAEVRFPAYRRNGADRCYHCKAQLFGALSRLVASDRLAAVVDGTNADDLDDARPGLRAATEHGVRHPLADAGFSKANVRRLSLRWGLPTHDKPAAPCLASRIPPGEPVTEGKLARIERAEGLVRSFGFRELRVRHFEGAGKSCAAITGPRARVEVPECDLDRLRHAWAEIAPGLAALGYREAEIEPAGLRSGRLACRAAGPGAATGRPPAGEVARCVA